MSSFKTIYQEVVGNQYDFGTGTWAVDSDKIEMKLDQYGAYHPYLTEPNWNFTDEEVELFKQTCLSTSTKNESDIAKSLFDQVSNIKYNPQLGYYCGLYIGHVLEGNYRKNGSSGGFVTWICSQLLRHDYIDAVIHVKKSEQPDKLFEYDISRDESGLNDGAKTKYYPVEYSEVIKTVKEVPGRYAVVGLPSYIMELRLLADQDPIIKDRLRFMIGLVCGHQKTTKFAEFLAWQCGIKPGDLKTINFRKKQEDSPASKYAIELVGTIDGEERTIVKKMSELVGGNWGQGMFKIRASDFTDDVMNETADVTLGDAWLPEYTTDSKGNNIVIVRHPVIKKLIEDAIGNHLLQVDRSDEDTIFRSQSSHFRHTQNELSYRLYCKDKSQDWRPQKRIVASKNISMIRRRIQDKRAEICLQTPTLYQKAVEQHSLKYFIKEITPLTNSYKNLYRMQRIENKLHRILSKK
ncbi:coenzyme F420 hydrogenase [Lactiplantibacillus paraplantarum]|uniref:Coenzyme F420 hydrogenase/dehydrogenase, beta subunit C-terminal domain n=1 Tax=Lactiplantibacillus paraplantarum TaxID=60520 RepID=UPI00068C3982|nr:Coenzyme F420 hydrogenase/dehydrogenase, beta subunit C-terminal domain [Lactiplantibacillus paraplantarum]ALO02912.1 coenzyme F420 hydrogenase [Lactiplantibacillus paraplantarum]